MSDSVISGYADALYAVAAAEGDARSVTDELYAFAAAVESNDELRSALADSSLPAAQRQQVVEDVLADRASRPAVALASLIVGAGRGAEIGEIVRALGDKVAAEHGREVAEVRAAVPLSDEQVQRLTTALETATGKNIDVRVIVDPKVVGGVVTQIGDTVIDGSVRTRLNKMRESFA